ncbi:MAG TPA: hypothetical protein VFY28_03590 [Candidatus Paceibacterota bacterium]|nr:hypothetical protein [Candidatus Paceibacterota bacterium]
MHRKFPEAEGISPGESAGIGRQPAFAAGDGHAWPHDLKPVSDDILPVKDD